MTASPATRPGADGCRRVGAHGDSDLVTFFVGVDDINKTVAQATELGGRVVQAPVSVPGVSFALIADPQGQVVGLAQQG